MIRFIKIFILLIILFVMACQINRVKDGKRHGRWVYKTNASISKGRYLNGIEVGVWKDFVNGKLVSKERYKGNVALVKNYYPNGKIESKGQTLMDRTPKQIHWYFYGDWLYYNEKGELKEKITYIQGNEVLSVKY